MGFREGKFLQNDPPGKEGSHIPPFHGKERENHRLKLVPATGREYIGQFPAEKNVRLVRNFLGKLLGIIFKPC